MTPPDGSPRVPIDIHHPALLAGLESWLQLGLISDAGVRHLAATHLTCPLPPLILEPEVISPPVDSSVRQRPRRRPLARGLSALMAELSVLWLLILGVFLVVVSSAVLAATQWEQFSAAAQYSILGLYTLAFGGASLSLGRRPQLRLTAPMLQLATLILIPVNFWMMDALKVLQSPGGWGVVAIAVTLLTLLWIGFARLTESPGPHRLGLIVNGILLSWLHWGWAIDPVPFMACYGGVAVTVAVLVYDDWRWHRHASGSATSASAAWAQAVGHPLLLALVSALLLLLLRAMFEAQISLAALGLAFGSCGWLLGWLTRRTGSGWIGLSGILMAGGRIASGMLTSPWPALILSGLALGLFWARWRRHQRRLDLMVVLGLGLQAFWPLRRLLPDAVRQDWAAGMAAIAGSSAGLPDSLWGVALFPYLWAILALATRLPLPFRRDVQQFGLALGVGLSLISLANPWVRVVNLTLTTATLLGQVRHSRRTGWIYLTQGTGLAAIASFLIWRFPSLSTSQWATAGLVLALLEWAVGGLWPRLEPRVWRQSAWWLGLGLATLSYWLWLAVVLPPSASPSAWIGARWVAVPLLLLGLSQWGHYPAATLSGWLSLLGFVVMQPLTFGLPGPRILGLVLAWLGSSHQTQRLQHAGAAALAIGFGLTLGFTSLWLIWASPPEGGEFLLMLATSTLLLWGLTLAARRWPQLHSYRKAAWGWAGGLSGLTLLLVTLTILYLGGQASLSPEARLSTYQVGGAALIVFLGLAAQTYNRPGNLEFWGLAWSADLLLLVTLRLSAWHWEALALGHIAVGLLLQLAGDLWVHRRGGPYRWSWHGIPLVYALFAWMYGHTDFTATTGFYSLGVAMIGLGVGRRGLKPILYLALLMSTLGLAELVLYQLSQVESAFWGDGLIVLAALGLTLAGLYRLGAARDHPFWHLSAADYRWGGHLHWAASLGLLGLSRVTPLSQSGSWGWVGVALGGAAYALEQGRRQPLWIYLGLSLGLAAVGTGLGLLGSLTQLLPWGGAIAALLALLLYLPPWQQWGWPPQPWRHIALLLPGFVSLLTLPAATLTSQLITAATYVGFALSEQRVRLSYAGLIFANLALWRLLSQWPAIGIVGHATLVGGSLLYLTQIDPGLSAPDQRHLRHWLRLLATSLMCLATLYESDGAWIGGLLAAGGFLILIVLGLGLQVRAFLYIGTLAFTLKVIRQLWLFIASNSILLWAIGIVLGLILIWIAATFEARRNQLAPWLQSWVETLNSWE